jgi:hypothetical protein
MPAKRSRPPARRITRLTLLRALLAAALARLTYRIRIRARAQHPGRHVKAATA